jgi:hypothetical protein
MVACWTKPGNGRAFSLIIASNYFFLNAPEKKNNFRLTEASQIG